jgi:hypothetical protein
MSCRWQGRRQQVCSYERSYRFPWRLNHWSSGLLATMGGGSRLGAWRSSDLGSLQLGSGLGRRSDGSIGRQPGRRVPAYVSGTFELPNRSIDRPNVGDHGLLGPHDTTGLNKLGALFGRSHWSCSSTGLSMTSRLRTGLLMMTSRLGGCLSRGNHEMTEIRVSSRKFKF